MAVPELLNVVVSMVWVNVLPSVFEPHRRQGELVGLADQTRYERMFGGTGEAPRGLGDKFGYPWVHPVGQHFWSCYLQSVTLDGITGPTAWSGLVPIRERLEAVKPEDADVGFVPEVFYYPFGLGLIVTLRLRRPTKVDAAVDEMYDLTHDASYGVSIDGTALNGRLAELAPTVLKALGASRLGNRGEIVQPMAPFSICTVVQADPIESAKARLDKGPLPGALAGLASWSPTWRNTKTLAADRIHWRTAADDPDKEITYMSDRGRAVWFPTLFAPAGQKRHSLTCYHRNLTFSALTADALSCLMLHADRHLGPAGSPLALPFYHKECLRNGAAHLRDLYVGAPSTYRSRSVLHQIAHNGGRDAYNHLAARLQLPALP